MLMMTRAYAAGAFVLVLSTVAGAEPEAKWSYKDPKTWDKYENCKTGNRQSPINLKMAAPLATQRGIRFDSDRRGTANNPKDLRFKDSKIDVKFNNTGNNLEIEELKIKGKEGIAKTFLYLGYEGYFFANVHFHSPAEHFDPATADMEMHIVNTSGKKRAVLAVGLRKGGGDNPALAPFFSNVGSDIAPAGLTMDLITLIPAEKSITARNFLDSLRPYYSYEGSLTTPDCEQNVSWYLFEDTLAISEAQIAAFKKRFANTRRPFQTFNNEVHSLFRCCYLDPPP